MTQGAVRRGHHTGAWRQSRRLLEQQVVAALRSLVQAVVVAVVAAAAAAAVVAVVALDAAGVRLGQPVLAEAAALVPFVASGPCRVVLSSVVKGRKASSKARPGRRDAAWPAEASSVRVDPD